jgi:flagellar biogenesis protein FliO
MLAGLLGFTVYRQKKTASQQGAIKPMTSLGRLQLAPQQHLHLIECGDRAFLVGSTNSQISLLQSLPLDTIRTPKEDEPPRQSVSAAPFSEYVTTLPAPPDFAALLQRQSAATASREPLN